MREKLIAAARECRSATFRGATAQIAQIRMLAFEIADQFGRDVQIEERNRDVVVTFTARASRLP
jgi:hypothetical protein